MLTTIIIATTTVSLTSIVGILLIFKDNHKKNLKPLIALAAGSLLGVAFLDLLPEAFEAGSKNFDLHFISMIVLLSILAFFMLERVLHWHHCSDDITEHVDHKHSIVPLNLIGDSLHNMIDGFLIAGSFMLDFNTGVLVTIAVILHEIPQEIFDFGILIHGGLNKTKALLFNIFVSLSAIGGAVIFFYFGQTFEYLIPIITAVAAGNFIYLATADLIPELHHEARRSKIFQHAVLLFLGVGIIYSVNTILPHTHKDDHSYNQEEAHEDEELEENHY